MKKHLFHLPDGVIYLDGNSLGPLPIAAAARLDQARDEWADLLITGWNKAGWMAQPQRLGNRIARLIGAADNSVIVGDTLSIKVFQALAAGLNMRPGRQVVLSDNGNFPTDLYMAEGLLRTMGRDLSLKVVDPEDVADHLDDSIAVMMLTEVDYRTGRKHDMAALTRLAHENGAVAMWDLAHSAGALPVDLAACNAELAVGCTYKYLNGGPGAPAFIYVRPDLADSVDPALAGWLGHQAPFAFDLDYRPAEAIGRMRVGTPPVLQMATLEAALDIWDDVSIHDVRARSITLSERFISEVETRCPNLTLASPRNPDERGSQVSFTHPEGYAIMQALIARGVIGDFRAPDAIRFGFTPLYLDEADIVKAAEILEQIMTESLWDNPTYRVRAAVT
ncbi:MAG: kynureninase [Silicimonas sp.]|nr:kynureninase [Silicimonas sp.]